MSGSSPGDHYIEVGSSSHTSTIHPDHNYSTEEVDGSGNESVLLNDDPIEDSSSPQ